MKTTKEFEQNLIEIEYENKRAEIKQAEQHKAEIEAELVAIKLLLFRLNKEKLSIIEKSIEAKKIYG